MRDVIDHQALFRKAESQGGYFTAHQAEEVGVDRRRLSYHAGPEGRYERVYRGVYRVKLFPTAPHEEIIAAWLQVGIPEAVVSHESAFELLGLSDLISHEIHLTIPREKRSVRRRPGVRLHTSSRLPTGTEVRRGYGVPVTSPERSIVDVLETGGLTEQVELAVRQSLSRGLTTPQRLLQEVTGRSRWVEAEINRLVNEVIQ
jgi:predicted transcriptional regulator of viral defense system